MTARLFAPTDGAVQETETVLFALFVALSAVGAPGVVTGVALWLPEALPHPLLLYAATVKVYAVPFVKPVNWYEVADEPTATGEVTPFGAGEIVMR